MWNPGDHTEYWYSPGPMALVLGDNRFEFTPEEYLGWWTYAIVIPPGAEVKFDSYIVNGGENLVV